MIKFNHDEILSSLIKRAWYTCNFLNHIMEANELLLYAVFLQNQLQQCIIGNFQARAQKNFKKSIPKNRAFLYLRKRKPLKKRLIFEEVTLQDQKKIKNLSQITEKIHFQNCYLKKCITKTRSLKKYIFEIYIFKIIFSKNIDFRALIYFSSKSLEPSKELSKSSIICLTITFS